MLYLSRYYPNLYHKDNKKSVYQKIPTKWRICFRSGLKYDYCEYDDFDGSKNIFWNISDKIDNGE